MPKIVDCPSRGNRDASNKKNGQVMFTKKRERALPRGNRDTRKDAVNYLLTHVNWKARPHGKELNHRCALKLDGCI